MRLLAAVVVTTSLLAVACGSTGAQPCIAGQSAACSCTNGKTGAQLCQPDGLYGLCQCDGPATTACNANTCAGCCDASGACKPGTSVSACGRTGSTCSVCNGDQTCSSTGSCSGGGTGGGGAGGGGGNVTPGPKRVFITKTAYTGALGGLTGGDQKCNLAAQAANLGGTWRAWLSDSSSNAIDRIQGNGPWYTLGSADTKKVVFNNRANLATSSVAAIRYDENNGYVSGEYAWTGTSAGGTASGLDCNNWTSNDYLYSGTYGLSSDTTGSWTDTNDSYCDSSRHLYCFEQ